MDAEVKVKQIPSCDICVAEGRDVPKPAVVDGKTAPGPWAFMCREHFKALGVGLGLGRGQRLERGETGRPTLSPRPRG